MASPRPAWPTYTFSAIPGSIPASDAVVYSAIWGLVGIACTTSISWIIYGLRLQVQQAMQLGQYRLEEKIGEGAMGVVYRASHAMLRRPCAIKVLSGTIRSDDHLRNPRTGADERLHAPFVLRGKEQVPVDELRAGDIGAVAKLTSTVTGDTFSCAATAGPDSTMAS